jgi:hypothetical protein
MEKIKNIPSSCILAVDIETVRIEENFKDLSPIMKEAWGYKHKQDGIIPSEEELSDLWTRTSSLYPEFSKICAISLSFLSKDRLKCKSYASTDEEIILTTFAEDLEKFQKANPNFRLLGHAALYFDYPFMAKRYIINQLPIPKILDSSNLKPWEQTNLDTNELYKGFGTGPGSSLQALCAVLSIQSPKVDLVGDEVGKAYYAGEIARIGTYCNYDVVATFNVFRRFKYEPIFDFEDVEYVNKGEVLTAVPLMDLVKANGYITENQISKLRRILFGASDKEKENARKLVEIATNQPFNVEL